MKTHHTILTSFSALILIGPPVPTETHCIQLIQKTMCPCNGCGSCPDCTALHNKQHYASLWLTSNKKYTLENIEPIFAQTKFKLEDTQHFFIIVERADLLSTLCQNKLLKLVEEPPQGYRFIFLAERENNFVLPLKSRCITQYITASEIIIHDILIKQLTNLTPDLYTLFEYINIQCPTEPDTLLIIDQLMRYINQLYKKTNDNEEQEHIKQQLSLITQAIKEPLPQGSSKIFWRNFVIAWHQLAIQKSKRGITHEKKI